MGWRWQCNNEDRKERRPRATHNGSGLWSGALTRLLERWAPANGWKRSERAAPSARSCGTERSACGGERGARAHVRLHHTGRPSRAPRATDARWARVLPCPVLKDTDKDTQTQTHTRSHPLCHVTLRYPTPHRHDIRSDATRPDATRCEDKDST